MISDPKTLHIIRIFIRVVIRMYSDGKSGPTPASKFTKETQVLKKNIMKREWSEIKSVI